MKISKIQACDVINKRVAFKGEGAEKNTEPTIRTENKNITAENYAANYMPIKNWNAEYNKLCEFCVTYAKGLDYQAVNIERYTDIPEDEAENKKLEFLYNQIVQSQFADFAKNNKAAKEPIEFNFADTYSSCYATYEKGSLRANIREIGEKFNPKEINRENFDKVKQLLPAYKQMQDIGTLKTDFTEEDFDEIKNISYEEICDYHKKVLDNSEYGMHVYLSK